TGRTEAAFSLFCDIEDWGAMGQLVMKQAPLMLAQGRYRTLEEWLDSGTYSHAGEFNKGRNCVSIF
ncbi:MAG: hypothetical protein Q8N70_06625, partial [Deltaproteobacteria bacterium]|nr:hypothetical protein [Deltaproteobacteria bacterium]